MSHSISLCVVTRNEAPFIRECLESALPVVDEAIVVDTGSTDGTPDLARAAGARVIHAGWPGDLGRAHNLPLERARARWVLSLDGDEVLDPNTRHLLPTLVRSARVDAYRLPIRNYSFFPGVKLRAADPADLRTHGALGYFPTAVVRLHRNRPWVRHRGRLHQSLQPSILERGGIIDDAPVPIHHYGPLRMDKDKSALYRILTRLQVDDTPDDAQAWFDLGMQFSGRSVAAAVYAFRRAYDLGLRGAAAYMLGRVFVEMGHGSRAVRWLNRAVAENADDGSPQYDRADALEALAVAFELDGAARKAERARAKALALRPFSPETANNLASQLVERGALRRAASILGPLTAAVPGLSMPWASLGALRYLQDDLDGARSALETALDISPTNGAAMINLALTHQVAGRPRDAARILRTAAHARQAHEPGGHVPTLWRPRARAIRRLGPRGVVSIVPSLHGGAGQVAVDAVRALRGRPQLLLCADAGEFAGQRLARELKRTGVELRVVGDDNDIVRAISQASPETVIDHWGRHFFLDGPIRVDRERWIAVGHGAFSLPCGYDDYVAISDFTAGMQAHLAGRRVHRISNAVDLRRFRPRRLRGEGVTIAALTRLDPGKLPRQLLAYLPDLRALGARLIVAGRGRRQHELAPELRAMGLSDVVSFVGVIPASDTPAFLAAADIGLHLTETEQEACSITVLEMLATGLPIVGQPKGCLPEMVAHGVNGLLATEPSAIANCLEQLIRSPKLRARMGGASRRRAEKRYGMSLYRSKMRALVSQHPPPARRTLPTSRGDRPTPEAISLRECRPSQSYLICCTPRSGSNLLCEALINTGLAGFPDEAFFLPNDRIVETADAATLERVLAERIEARTTANGVFGTKLFSSDMTRLVQRLAEASPTRGRSVVTLLTSLCPRLKLVRMIRRDRLRQAISRVRASAGGPWMRTRDELLPVRVRVTAGSITQMVNTIDTEEAEWDEFFRHWPVPPIVVAYEDLAADYEGTARRLVDALGIAAPYPIVFGKRVLERQADAVTERWVRRMRRSRQDRAER